MTTRMNVEDLVAIDMHTHVLGSCCGHRQIEDPAVAALHDKFGFDHMPNLDEMADEYRARRMAFVAFTIDDIFRTGVEPPVSSIEIAKLASKHRDICIPFGSVDPHRGKEALVLAKALIEEYGVKGFKFHPSQQAFSPDDRMAWPLYELLSKYKLPALFHTGQTGVGSALPGGGGILLKYSNPMHLDEVAAEFPDMPIVFAHPSVPWQDEALSVAVHKSQVYIDLSGWSPKYFPPQLVQHANSLLQDRVLFGTDFPLLTPERWIKDFETLNIKDSVKPKIMKANAVRLLKLA